LISIIIPAHNEDRVIKSTLTSLLPGIDSGELEVVVVCNGCTDRTADVVRAVSDSIDCVEVEKPSKANALNIGESRVHGFPRLYLDADICISASDIISLACQMNLQLIIKPKSVILHSGYCWR